MVRWLAALLILFFACQRIALASDVPEQPAATPVPQIFLIQNSGWMEPFYTADNIAAFRRTLSGMINALTDDGATGEQRQRITIASFNQDGQVADRRSPDALVHDYASPAVIEQGLNGLDLPHKADGHLADSDFLQAMNTAISWLDGKHGIVWLVTNNLPSPNNDQNVGHYNHQLHDFLLPQTQLAGVQVNPLPLPVKGQLYELPGFMVYGFAFGDMTTETYLLKRAQAANNVMPWRFGRLRPLEQEPLEVNVQHVTPDKIRPEWDTTSGGRPRLILSGVDGGEEISIRLTGTLKSIYYPLRIRSAMACGDWQVAPDQEGAPANVTLTMEVNHSTGHCVPIGPIDPGGEVSFSVTVSTPNWKPKDVADLYESGKRLQGDLQIKLHDIKPEPDDAFIDRIHNFYFDPANNASKLPELYLGYKNVRDAVSVVAVAFDIPSQKGPGAALIAAMVLGGLAIVAGLAWLARQSLAKNFTVPVGNTVRDVRLRHGESKIVPAPDGYARVQASRNWLGRLTTTPLPPRNR